MAALPVEPQKGARGEICRITRQSLTARKKARWCLLLRPWNVMKADGKNVLRKPKQPTGDNQMKEFMFVYKGGDPKWMATATAEEKQAVMAKWGAWFESLGKKGQLVAGGSPLEPGGKRLKKDGVVTDIAASEFKELVSGYSIVKAASDEEAVAIARECPIFRQEGASLEVRTVIAM
jgi:hypothetical protein